MIYFDIIVCRCTSQWSGRFSYKIVCDVCAFSFSTNELNASTNKLIKRILDVVIMMIIDFLCKGKKAVLGTKKGVKEALCVFCHFFVHVECQSVSVARV